MSYNVDTWKTKKLEALLIPKASFFKHPRSDWHPTLQRTESGETVLGGFESIRIRGKMLGDLLHVESIEVRGEGSGTFIEWILGPALADSKGTLEAILVWEGGDSITSLKVNDGKIESKEIDL